MKESVLSGLGKEEQSHSHFKYEQNSLRHCEEHQYKSRPFFIRIQKAIFLKLRLKKQSYISSVLYQLENQSASIDEKQYLIEYLSKIQKLKFNLESKYFNKSLKHFKRMFLSKIVSIWEQLSEQGRIEYEQVGISNYQRMIQRGVQQKVSKDKFSGFQMLKIDVLCVFFLFNKYYLAAFEDFTRKLLPNELLEKLFDLSRIDLTKMDQNFKQLQKDIRIDYRKEIHQDIELLYLMRVGCKLCNYANYTRTKVSNIPFAQIQLDVDLTDQAYTSKNPKFRFCQIAFQSNKQVYIVNLKKQKELLQILKQYCISLKFFVKMSSSNKSINQNIACFKSNIWKFPWIFLKVPYQLTEGINAIFGGVNQSLYQKKLRLIPAITKVAFERFSLLPSIFQMQMQLQSKLPIYVYKFQYSLRDIIFKKHPIEQQVQDLKCTLVILVANQRILAYSTIRNSLTYDFYMGVVKICIKSKVIPYTNLFNLVLYELDYQHTIDYEYFTQFQIYMNKNYDARIYIVNDPSIFQPHFLIHAFIKSFLMELNINSKNFHQYAQVCIHHLLKGIGFFDKEVNKEYFDYFTKIMSLEFGIKDVWKCFKKSRENKYDAIILGRQETQEGYSQKKRFMLRQELPSSEWFKSIQYCIPNYDNFLKCQEQEKWREIESFEDCNSNGLQYLLQSKHMMVKDIKRILRDVSRFLIDYQLFYQQLTKNHQGTEKSVQFTKIQTFLFDFYEKQNRNIDQLYSRPERQVIIKQFAKKYDKSVKVSDVLNTKKSKSLKESSKQE